MEKYAKMRADKAADRVKRRAKVIAEAARIAERKKDESKEKTPVHPTSVK